MYIIYEYSCLHLLHCMWLGYIRSYMEDPSHRFLAIEWLVHSPFVDLGNPLEVVVHHLLIEGVASLSYWNGFPMVSALVCMVTHWIGPMVSHELRLSSSYDLTKLLHCVVSQPWENIEIMLKLVMTFSYRCDRKPIRYSHWIRLQLMEFSGNRYSQ